MAQQSATIQDFIKKSKYELIEESTGQVPSVTEVDDKNDPEQKTVTVDAATGEEVYEHITPPKPIKRQL